MNASDLNTYDVINAETILIVKDSVAVIHSSLDKN
jgi:hypothetical protein